MSGTFNHLVSLEYLKGMLHTYGHLNMPAANLWTEFDIIEFEDSEDEFEKLRNRFGISKNTEIALKPVSSFREELLPSWLFNSGELQSISLDPVWKKAAVETFYTVLEKVTQLKSVVQFTFKNDYGYDYGEGIYSIFFLIQGSEKKIYSLFHI